jgi:homoserine kinase
MPPGIKVKAPATISNINCGFDVLGMALDVTCDEIIARKLPSPGIQLTLTGELARATPSDPMKNTAGMAVSRLLEFLGASKAGMHFDLRKQVRPGSGMGSSAASACAAVVAANEILGRPLPKEQLLPFAILGEYSADQAFHADNIAPALLGGVILVRDVRELDVQRLYTPPGLFVCVVRPDVTILTSEARGVLRRQVDLSQMIRQTADLGAFVIGMERSDFGLISRALRDHVIEEQRAHLIPGFREAKEAALAQGALGCGISGAGPAIFALTDNHNTAGACGEAMTRVFASRELETKVYVSTVNERGTELC